MGNHWTLGVIDKKNKSLIFLNSLKNMNNDQTIRNDIAIVAKYLFEEITFEWIPYDKKYSIQNLITLDCGFYVMNFIVHVIYDLEIISDASDFKKFKNLMAKKFAVNQVELPISSRRRMNVKDFEVKNFWLNYLMYTLFRDNILFFEFIIFYTC